MHVATSDPRLDLSLRFLSLIVSGAIALTLLWYLFVLIEPWIDLERWQGSAPIVELDPLSTVTRSAADDVGPPASAAMTEALAAPVQLLAPAFTVFRCDLKGGVTYTDRPCDRGGMRILRLPRS